MSEREGWLAIIFFYLQFVLACYFFFFFSHSKELVLSIGFTHAHHYHQQQQLELFPVFVGWNLFPSNVGCMMRIVVISSCRTFSLIIIMGQNLLPSNAGLVECYICSRQSQISAQHFFLWSIDCSTPTPHLFVSSLISFIRVPGDILNHIAFSCEPVL